MLLLVTFAPIAKTYGQKPPVPGPRTKARQPAMATLVKVIAQKGEETVLSGYVAVIMNIASDFSEQVPAKAIALEHDATHSRLLCLVRKNGTTTVLMLEVADAYITAYAMTPAGDLKKAAQGPQYQEFHLISPEQAGAGFKAAKEFWLQQTAAMSSPSKTTPKNWKR